MQTTVHEAASHPNFRTRRLQTNQLLTPFSGVEDFQQVLFDIGTSLNPIPRLMSFWWQAMRVKLPGELCFFVRRMTADFHCDVISLPNCVTCVLTGSRTGTADDTRE